MIVDTALQERENQGRPIRVGMVGASATKWVIAGSTQEAEAAIDGGPGPDRLQGHRYPRGGISPSTRVGLGVTIIGGKV